MAEKLFIGLDIGTDSVGWAATDENFKLKRLKGKTAWGSRIFAEASDAKSRRTYRSSGRRLARRRERINLLNTLFDPMLRKTDPTFLMRLENSSLQNDDENKPNEAKNKCLLFGNKQMEKAFFKKYPTIWHLRKALIENEDDAYLDIRYLYLAIHHIIKYRGNFIKSGDNDGLEFEKELYLDRFNGTLKQLFETNDEDDSLLEDNFIGLPKENYDEFMRIAEDKLLGKGEKKKKLVSLMKSDPDSKCFLEMFCTLSAGGTYSTKKLNGNLDEEYGDVSVTFDSSYDENEPKFRDALGDAFDLVEIAKAIYDYCDLKDILNGNKFLSDAFVEIYDSHKKQLSSLKKICKFVDSKHGFVGEDSVYVKVFNEKDNAKNYAAFTHNKTNQKRCDIHTFDKYVIDLLKPYDVEIQNSEHKLEWHGLMTLAEQDRLLQTIALRSTSVIPMQLHKTELEIILDNAAKRGIAGIGEIKDKLLSLFQYKIPYYCGPLTDKSQYSNVAFKNGKPEKILPWNYKELIDWDKTKQNFMNGLTNKCSYLKDKNVLPKNSILFQDYDTWNKLNNIMVNGAKLSASEMKEVFDNLASRRLKTTARDIGKHLASINNSKPQDIVVSGINEKDYINCSSRSALCAYFDLSTRYTEDFKVCERAIFLLSIYCDSKQDGMSAIKKEFPKLSDSQYKALMKLSCKGWSTLSKELLSMRRVDQYGVVQCSSIIDAMENGEGNFMQVFAKYDFKELVDRHNYEIFGSLSKKEQADMLIENMPPKMRRPVIQALRIVQEISKVAKQDPEKIAIEVTRESNDSKKKKKLADKAISRKEQIEKFLKSLTENSIEKDRAKEIGEELNSQELSSLQGKHLFLYFMQNGKDVYSGKPINIDDVLDGTKYDTDHIIPQSLMKDDSIDNLVLVSRATNQHRSNQFPLPEEIRNNRENRALWLRLKKAGGMSEKKYNNLIRSAELTEDELASFVSAQINVVNRSNVVLRDVLHIFYPNAKLIFSKAQYPSQIRQELNIPKLRDLNDTHHAVDAYLNIVAGVSLTDKFGDMRIVKAMAKKDGSNVEKSLNMTNYISSLIVNKDGTVKEFGKFIDDISRRHDFLLTYRFDYQDNAFYDQTINPKSDSTALVAVHDTMDTTKYGGYNNASVEANCVVDIVGSKKVERYLLGVPHLLIEKAKKGLNISEELLKLVPCKKTDKVTLHLDKLVPLAVTVKKSGCKYLLVGMNAKQVVLKPFSPIFLSRESEIYLNKLLKCVEKDQKEYDTAFGSKTISVDKNGINKYTFTIEKSKKVAEEIFGLSEQLRFDYCSMICDLRSDVYRQETLNLIETSSFAEQSKILKYLLGVFTRNSNKLSEGKYFSKTRKAIMDGDLTICSDSITGLYSSERRL